MAIHYHPKNSICFHTVKPIYIRHVWNGWIFLSISLNDVIVVVTLDRWRSVGTLFKAIEFFTAVTSELCCGFPLSLMVCLLSTFMSLHPAVTARGMTEWRMMVFWGSGIVFLRGLLGMWRGDITNTFLQTGDRRLRCHFPLMVNRTTQSHCWQICGDLRFIVQCWWRNYSCPNYKLLILLM